MFNLIIFGPPGCGKGTQSKLVASEFGFLHLSTGDLFRLEIERNTALGQIAAKFINRGFLIPDNIVMRELYRFALENMNAKGIVFDGFPRTLEQAIMLDKVFHKKELRIELVISMIVDENVLVKRIIERGKDSGRADDNLEISMKRIEIYKELTEPVIDFYKNKNILFEVNGMDNVNIVAKKISEIIKSSMNYK